MSEAVEDSLRAGVALVAVDIDVPHLDHPFEYAIPLDSKHPIGLGSQVEVRFAGRKVKGWVTGLRSESESGRKLAPILRALSPLPLLTRGILESSKYLSTRYATSLTQVLSFVVPARRASEEKKVDPLHVQFDEETPERKVRRSVATLFPGQKAEFIRKGVQAQLSSNRSVIVVLPTSAEVDLLADYLSQNVPGIQLGVANATGSPQKRYRAYLEARAGIINVVVGTRSAVWTPLKNLGAIIIWDDGDDRLKERKSPRFDSLDVAVARSHVENLDLLVCSYSRSVKAELLLQTRWAQDASPPRDPNLVLLPKVRVFDWFSADREGAQGSTRFPDAAYSVIREGLRDGAVLVQVAAAGYATPIPCSSCGSVDDEEKSCEDPFHQYEHRLRIGSDKIREDLAAAFPNASVRVSSSTAGVIRGIDPRPQIIVATTGAEPTVLGGYSSVVITETEGLAYLDELWAPLEALRRWFNALSLAAPGAPAMIIGSFDEVTSRAVVLWRPEELAKRLLEERIELGFPPARWVVIAKGDEGAIQQTREAVAGLQLSEPRSNETRQQGQHIGMALPDLAILAEHSSVGRSSIVVSCTTQLIAPLMSVLRQVQVDRSKARRTLIEIEVNPDRIALDDQVG